MLTYVFINTVGILKKDYHVHKEHKNDLKQRKKKQIAEENTELKCKFKMPKKIEPYSKRHNITKKHT